MFYKCVCVNVCVCVKLCVYMSLSVCCYRQQKSTFVYKIYPQWNVLVFTLFNQVLARRISGNFVPVSHAFCINLYYNKRKKINRFKSSTKIGSMKLFFPPLCETFSLFSLFAIGFCQRQEKKYKVTSRCRSWYVFSFSIGKA